MVGFTQKKQALHDIIADTVVIYKDPNKKTKTWLIVLVLIFALIIPVGVGIAASVFFVSMNTAINKAQDAQKQSALKFENVQKQINTSVNNTNQSSSVNSAPASAPVSVTNSATAIAPATSGIDYSGKTAVLAINVDIKKYYSSKGTYKDYVAYVADFKESLPDYIYKKIADTTVDVSPDGKIFVIYYPIEGNTKQSWCIENNMPDAIISDTSLIQKTYHCK